MAAYLSLIVQAAQRDAGILTVQGIGNRFAQRGLAHARRTIQTQDGGLEVTPQFQHRQVLQDAVFDFLQAVMVVIEFLLHLFEVKVVLGISVPRQIEHVVEVGILHRVVGCLRVEAFQFAQFFLKLLFHVLVPFHLLAS